MMSSKSLGSFEKNRSKESSISKQKQKKHSSTSASALSRTNAEKEEYKRRIEASVNVIDFAHRKGTARAIQSYHDRKDKKRLETSKVLRSYKKTMIREGYIPGTGASRKRRIIDTTNSANTNNSQVQDVVKEDKIQVVDQQLGSSDTEVAPPTTTTPSESKTNNQMKKNNDNHINSQQQKQLQPNQYNRFTKSIRDNNKRKEQIEEQIKKRQENEIQRKLALDKRRRRSALLKRSNNYNDSKRQPKMKFVVHDILNRLQQQPPPSKVNE